MKGDEEKAFEAGCDGYITKPIDTRSFPALIRQYLSKPNDVKNTSPERATTMSQVGGSREAFLADGAQRSAALISSLGSNFDAISALAVVHQWAETASSLGCQEISQYSRELEGLIEQNGRGSLVRTRELLVRLARAFSESKS
jgi:CheY-like chemotaxis protein